MIEDGQRANGSERRPEGFRPLAALFRHWRTIVGVTVLTALVASAVTSFLPKSYRARIVLYPAEGKQSSAQAMLGQNPLAMMALGGASNPNRQLIGLVLNSRSIQDTIKRRVGAPKRSKVDNGRPDGSIVIDVFDRDPEKAARIANLYPELANASISRIGLDASERRRQVLDLQLAAARARMNQAEARLTRFLRDQQGGPELAAQASATLQAATELQREIGALEIRVAGLRRTATAENPELRAAEADLGARRAQLRRLTTSGAGPALPSLNRSSELKVAAVREMREAEEAQQVYTTLRAQLLGAEMDVSKDLPAVSVLDPALVPKVPESISWPLVAVLSVLMGLGLGCGIVLLRAYLRSAREVADHREVFSAYDQFKTEVAGTVPIRWISRGGTPTRRDG
jgi:uncharacterized protein involved in exopolysaccharide biosynthesis